MLEHLVTACQGCGAPVVPVGLVSTVYAHMPGAAPAWRCANPRPEATP